MNATKSMKHTAGGRVLLISALAAAALSWGGYLLWGNSGSGHGLAQPLPGDRDSLQICVDGADEATRTAAKEAVVAAAATMRNDPESKYSELYARAPKVVVGCPGGPVDFRAGFLDVAGADLLEHRVDAPSPFLVHVYVSRGVPDGYQRVAFEMLCAGNNCGEVTAALFVDADSLASADIVREGLENALGVRFRRSERLAPNSRPAGSTDDKTASVPNERSLAPSAELLGKGVCVDVAEAEGAEVRRVLLARAVGYALTVGQDEASARSLASAVRLGCEGGYQTPTTDGAGLLLLPTPTGAPPSGVAVLLPAASERKAIFGDVVSSYRRAPVGECAPVECSAMAVYLNPGLLGDNELGLLVLTLHEALRGKELASWAPPTR